MKTSGKISKVLPSSVRLDCFSRDFFYSTFDNDSDYNNHHHTLVATSSLPSSGAVAVEGAVACAAFVSKDSVATRGAKIDRNSRRKQNRRQRLASGLDDAGGKFSPKYPSTTSSKTTTTTSDNDAFSRMMLRRIGVLPQPAQSDP